VCAGKLPAVVPLKRASRVYSPDSATRVPTKGTG
jgi:hypothetical protein